MPPPVSLSCYLVAETPARPKVLFLVEPLGPDGRRRVTLKGQVRRAVAGLCVQWPGEKKTRDWGVRGSVQVGHGGRQDMEVAGTGRTVGLTLKILGSHGRYVSRGTT